MEPVPKNETQYDENDQVENQEEEEEEDEETKMASNFELFMNKATNQEKIQENQQRFYQPPYIGLPDYENEQKVFATLPPLQKANQNHVVTDFQHSKFFVIRSKKFDDVHKAMKYGVWTSSSYNNKKFNKALREYGRVYLFFTVLNCDFFVGMAQILIPNEQQKEFAYWGEIGKWRGLMLVEWVLVRDVKFHMVTDLEENGVCLFDLKDGAEMSWENASQMIEFMLHSSQYGEIFQEFWKLDKREIKVRSKIDTLIKTGMIDMVKKDVDAKKQDNQVVKEEIKTYEEEPVVNVIKKKKKQKLTKKQKREFNKNKNN